MSDYDFVHKGALKLKGVADGGIKKKKKKSKSKKRDEEKPSTSQVNAEIDAAEAGEEELQQKTDGDAAEVAAAAKKFYAGKTKTEIAFLKRKEALDVERIRKKASVSHKERVETFNAYLNSLSEHYEPAKVSWTK